MVTELSDSRRERITINGHTIEQHFSATWAEWDVWSSLVNPADGVPLPIIGSPWSTRTNIFCSDIEANALIGKDEAEVTCFFSTLGSEFQEQTENRISSWEESLSINLEQEDLERYLDVSDPENPVWKDWYKVWVASLTAWSAGSKSAGDIFSNDGFAWVANVTTTDEPLTTSEDWEQITEAPLLTRDKLNMVFTRTCYGSVEYIGRISSFINKINTTKFALLFSTNKKQVSETYEDDIRDTPSVFNDIGKWKFQGCDMTKIGSNLLRYDMQFIFNPNGWNTTEGITTNLYLSDDLNDIFDDLSQTEEDAEFGLREGG